MSPMAQYWVSKGWIYFQIDNRGSPNRGRAFEDQIYHAMGTVEVEDQAAAARWLQKQPFVDAKKIATSGWSYGGYMSLKMLEKAPKGLYAAGDRRRAGDQVGAVRYPLYRAVSRQPGDRSKAISVVGRARRCAEDRGAVPADPRHVRRQCRLPELDRCSRRAAAGRPAVRHDVLCRPDAPTAGEGRQAHVQKTIERFLDEKVLGKALRLVARVCAGIASRSIRRV